MVVEVQQAIEILQKGGIVIFPTDTAFGIGCRIDSEQSVKKLFALRQRSPQKPTPILCKNISMVKNYTEDVPLRAEEQLMKRYWPGALTIIVPAKIEKVPSFIRGGTSTVGVRVPEHQTALSLIEGIGVPLVGTSANFPGKKTPYSVEELDSELVSLVDGVVEGECLLKKESTVVDCTQEPWHIVRQGAVQIKNE